MGHGALHEGCYDSFCGYGVGCGGACGFSLSRRGDYVTIPEA